VMKTFKSADSHVPKKELFVLGFVSFLVGSALLIYRRFFFFPPVDVILSLFNSEILDFFGASVGFLAMVCSCATKLNVKVISCCVVFINMFLMFVSLTSLFHFLFANNGKPEMLITAVALFGMIAVGLEIARNLPSSKNK
ncbi:MAG: holin, partial (endogenous virus) [Lactobacillus phage ViSo-2018a]